MFVIAPTERLGVTIYLENSWLPGACAAAHCLVVSIKMHLGNENCFKLNSG